MDVKHRMVNDSEQTCFNPRDRQDRFRSVVVRLGRVVVIAALLAVAAWAWGVWQFLIGTTGDAEQPPQQIPAMGVDLTASWTFAGIPWQVNVAYVKKNEVEQELMRQPVAPSHSPATIQGEQLLLDLFRSAESNSEDSEEGRVRSIRQEQYQGRLFTRTIQGTERVISARFAMNTEGDQWTVFSCSPDARGKTDAAPNEFMLPLPPSAKELCCRRSGPTTVLQVACVTDRISTLTELWQSNGWQVSPDPHNESVITCSFGADNVNVWIGAHEAARTRQIIFYRDLFGIETSDHSAP